MADTADRTTVPEPRAVVELVAPTLTHLAFETWNYGDSVGFEAMLAASDVLADPTFEGFAHGWGRAWACRRRPFTGMDNTAPGAALTHLAGRREDAQLVQALLELAGYLRSRRQWHGVYQAFESSPLRHPCGPGRLTPRDAALLADPPPGVFVDCLHFDPPFFAALGVLTQSAELISEALDQAVGYLDLLQQPDGLFHHFALRDRGTYGPGWGRGQGWALLGMLDVLAELDGQELSRRQGEQLAQLRAGVRGLISAMVGRQRADGGWPVALTDPGSGDETSVAAFMAAGFWRALGDGVVADAVVGAAAERAYAAMCRSLDESGVLQGVSAAVMACTESSHYANVPVGFVVPWGQGPVVLAAQARLRHEELGRMAG